MRHLLVVGLLALLLLAGCVPATTVPTAPITPVTGATAQTQGTARPLTKITLAMGYIPSVQFAPFYVAQERGYFKDAGLDVTFRYGFETDLLKLVGTDELQFMIGSGEETILGRSQGLPVRYVMRWYRKFPAVLFAKASKGIKSLCRSGRKEGRRAGAVRRQLRGLGGAGLRRQARPADGQPAEHRLHAGHGGQAGSGGRGAWITSSTARSSFVWPATM